MKKQGVSSGPALRWFTHRPQAMVPFTRQRLQEDEAVLVRKGSWIKPVIWQYQNASGEWIIKDYCHWLFILRWTWGQLIIRHEMKALTRLTGIDGIPQNSFRLDSCGLAYRMISGESIRTVDSRRLTAAFFRSAENIIDQIHRCQVVHLDTRNGRNFIIRPDGRAGLIDFQTHISVRHFPGWLRDWLCKIDFSGIYKQWRKKNPQTFDKQRLAVLSRVDRLRWLWIFSRHRHRHRPPPHHSR